MLFHPKGRRGRKFVGLESLIASLVLIRLEISSTIQPRDDLGEGTMVLETTLYNNGLEPSEPDCVFYNMR